MSPAEQLALSTGGVVHDGLAESIVRLNTAGATGILCFPRPPRDEFKAMTKAQRAGLKPRGCASVREFVHHYANVSATGLHLQRQLTAQFERHNRGLMCADPKTRARLDSAGDKNAYKWLTTPPSEFQFRMADIEVVRALRHRIGIAPMDGAITCRCGLAVTDHNYDHFHCCHAIRSEALDARHTVVQRSLARVAAMAGVAVQKGCSKKMTFFAFF
jgi:hypothetical protein